MQDQNKIDPIAAINTLEIEILDRLQVIKNILFNVLNNIQNQQQQQQQYQKTGKFVEFDSKK